MMVSKFIEAAFAESANRNRDIHQAWINASQYLGEQLPDSLLVVSVQRSGELDMLLRCMEEEYVLKRNEAQQSFPDFGLNYQMMLSELWVGQVYEFIRLLIERKLEPVAGQFSEVSHWLRLIRVPLEKHEIAVDRALSSPLEMQRFPLNNNETDNYIYTKGEATRSHIMPAGVSVRGSAQWFATDIKNKSGYWIERRMLSEKILEACRCEPQ